MNGIESKQINVKKFDLGVVGQNGAPASRSMMQKRTSSGIGSGIGGGIGSGIGSGIGGGLKRPTLLKPGSTQ